MDQTKVLFLCTGNSARSQMAEAFLRLYGGDKYAAYSAGVEPQGINPYTEKVMAEIGVDITGQRSKDLAEYMGKTHFSYLITVCAHAEERCPSTFPGVSRRLFWDFEDPAAAEGDEQAKLEIFRAIRDQIKDKVKLWVSENKEL